MKRGKHEVATPKFTTEFYAHVSRFYNSDKFNGIIYHPRYAIGTTPNLSGSQVRRTYLACKRSILQGRTRVETRYLEYISAPLDAINDGQGYDNGTGSSDGKVC